MIFVSSFSPNLPAFLRVIQTLKMWIHASATESEKSVFAKIVNLVQDFSLLILADVSDCLSDHDWMISWRIVVFVEFAKHFDDVGCLFDRPSTQTAHAVHAQMRIFCFPCRSRKVAFGVQDERNGNEFVEAKRLPVSSDNFVTDVMTVRRELDSLLFDSNRIDASKIFKICSWDLSLDVLNGECRKEASVSGEFVLPQVKWDDTVDKKKCVILDSFFFTQFWGEIRKKNVSYLGDMMNVKSVDVVLQTATKLPPG